MNINVGIHVQRWRRWASCGPLLAAWAALCACGDSMRVLVPVIDLPTSRPALPFPDVSELTLEVAQAGAVQSLTTKTFRRGDVVELADVPTGEDLVLHVTGLVNGQEIAYGRSCPFTVAAQGDLPTPHIFFSSNRSWSPFDGVPVGLRRNGLAIANHQGQAVFLSGTDLAGAPVAPVDQFVTADGSFADLTTLAARTAPQVAELGDHRFLISGGVDPTTNQAAAFFELLEVDASPESRVARVDDTLAVRDGAAVALANGRVAIIGGAALGDVDPIGRVVIVAPDGSTIKAFQSRANLVKPRMGHTATRLGDDLGSVVLVAGGRDGASPVATAELFLPLREAFVPVTGANPTMIVPRHHHHAVRMPDNSVLILGGFDAAGMPVRTMELFSLDAGFVEVPVRLPDGAGVVDFSLIRLPDNRLLLVGGRAAVGGPATTSAFVIGLDVFDGTVEVASGGQVQFARAGHQAVQLCDGTVMLAGGTDAAVPAERYNPSSTSRR
ncbi:MAG: hypothetical protein KBG15_07255 [Kofleriaceae bacterium]|nr:hypothetical protein [Kofleriaceae bacterium]